MTGRGTFLALGVLALFLAIFVPLALRVLGGNARVVDADRLRHTYVALTLYETEHDGRPAPNLGLVRRDVEVTDLESVSDPEVGKGDDFPLDPARPSFPLRSRTRVSWSYRRHWPESAKDSGLDPRRTVLADWWPGSLLRVTMDGAIVERPVPSARTFESLFGR